MTAVGSDKAATLAAVRVAGERFTTARTEMEQARKELGPLMVAALKAGNLQRDVQTLSGLTRESVRTIAREGGVEPARPQR